MNDGLINWARAGRNALNDLVLSPLDGISRTKPSSEYAPVFILGAPRCGSTLLSQLIIQCLEVGYFSNFHAQLYGSPALAEKLRRVKPQPYESDFSSMHGVTQGWTSPSENAAFWYRFFRRRPAFVPLSEMPKDKGRAFQRSVERFLTASNASVVIKNLYAALRLEVIQHYLPEARFIVLKRNLRDNAISILNSRKKIHGSYHQWWSVEPPDVDQLRKLDPACQVLRQIDSIYELIEAAKGRALQPKRTFLELEYETVCAQPRTVISSICDFIPGCSQRTSSIQALPPNFEPTAGSLAAPKLNITLSTYLDSR